MNLFATVAIIAAASTGLAPQDQAQSPLQRFSAARPDLEQKFANAQYKEIIEMLEGIIPSEMPEVQKDPQNPQVQMRSLAELAYYQDMHAYMGRALVMSGDLEQSIASFQKAKEISELKGRETEEFLSPHIQGWEAAIERSKNRLVEIDTLAKTRAELEAKKRLTSAEKKQLEVLKRNALGIEYEANTCKENIAKGPSAIEQIKQTIKNEKEASGRFALAIGGIEETMENEKEMVSSSFGGDKAKYVASVIDTKENLDSLPTRDDKIKFLNRLLFLDPNNKTVQQQLDLV